MPLPHASFGSVWLTVVVALWLSAAAGVGAQQNVTNVTEAWCLSMAGLSASVPFAVTWRLALAYQQPQGSSAIQAVQVNGLRHLSTPTTSVDSTLTGVASSTVNWTSAPTSVQSTSVYAVVSLLDPTSLLCPFPSVCQLTRSFSTSSALPTPSGGVSASGSAVTLQQLQVAVPSSATQFILQEAGDSLGASVAISSSSTQLLSVALYSAANLTLPAVLSSSACPTAAVPALSAAFLCLQQADPLSSYGAWVASSALVFSYVASDSFNPANPFFNFNNTGEAQEVAVTSALPVQDVTGLWNLTAPNSTSTARVLGFSYSALAGANPNFPLAAATQPFLYSKPYVLDSSGWQLQLDGNASFPDGAQSTLLRVGYFQDTSQWFHAYRGDQQLAFGSSITNASISSALYSFSPYVNRGAQRPCGGLPAFAPTRFVGPDNPSVLLSATTVRLGLWGAAQNYSVRPGSFPTPGLLAMQLLTITQPMLISALGVVSTAIESNIRMGLYALPQGQPFPSGASWTLLAETNRIGAIPTNLYITSPYTIEIPLNVSSPVPLSAGQLVAVVVYRFGSTLLMPGLQSSGANRTALYPAQFVDVGPVAAQAGFLSFAASLPSVQPSRLYAVGLDTTQMAAFLVGQTGDGSAFVDPYASVAVSPAYLAAAAAGIRPSSSTAPSGVSSSAAVAGSSTAVVSPGTVMYVTNNDNSWSGGTIAALVIALVLGALVCCLLTFIAFRLLRSSDMEKGKYAAVPAQQLLTSASPRSALPPLKAVSAESYPVYSGVEMQQPAPAHSPTSAYSTPVPVIPSRPLPVQ